jgi:lipoprotein-releasing system permease protein
LGYRFQIARRYLAGRRRFSLISIITSLSTVGVALGVASLIVVLSVMNGFYDFVQGVLVSRSPHVVVTPAGGEGGSAQGFLRPDSLAQEARRLRYVERAAPYVEGKALVAPRAAGGGGGGGGNRVVQVRGVRPAATAQIGSGPRDEEKDASESDSARYDLERSEDDGSPGIVVESRMAERLGLLPASPGRPGGTERTGSHVSLFSAPAIERVFTQIFGGPPLMQFEVRGVYEQPSTYDQGRAYIAYGEAQRLFHMDGRATGLALRLTDLDHADGVKSALQRQLGNGYRVETWYDLQGSLYDVMRLEKWGASAILLLIIVVAAFNIVGSMMMIVIEKQRDIGALKAMGASAKDVRRIFLGEGLLIGAVGTGAGLALGLSLAFLQERFSLVPMAQAESFLINAYPVAVRPLDVVLIAAAAMGLCALAAVYPARRAAAVQPARAVQGE